MSRIVAPFLLLMPLLAGCAGSSPTLGPNLAATSRHPGLSCAPFARELSGIALYGDAADWWRGADGRYARTHTPAVGSVLVFQREPRLASGHVSVVSGLVGSRQIHVIEANWVPGELDQDQLVVDVSPSNDWTEVRVWYPPINAMGSHAYPTYGFILPPEPISHDALARNAEPAARRANGSTSRRAG